MKKPWHNPFPKYWVRPGGAEHKLVSTDTLEGLTQAEKLKEQGWAIAYSSLFSIMFWRPKNKDER